MLYTTTALLYLYDSDIRKRKEHKSDFMKNIKCL